MLSFSLVAEALTGLIYHRPSGENSKFAFLRRLAKPEEFQIGHDRSGNWIDDERVSDESLMSSNL